MQLSEKTRFEQIPLAVVLKIAREEKKRPKKVAKKTVKNDRGQE